MKDQLNKKLRRTALLVAMLAAVFLAPASSDAQTRKPAKSAGEGRDRKSWLRSASIRLKRGVPAKVTFLRVSESTCATEVVFADYGIRRELPLNQAVTVSFTPRKAGEFAFTCGMNMHRGKLIIS